LIEKATIEMHVLNITGFGEIEHKMRGHIGSMRNREGYDWWEKKRDVIFRGKNEMKESGGFGELMKKKRDGIHEGRRKRYVLLYE